LESESVSRLDDGLKFMPPISSFNNVKNVLRAHSVMREMRAIVSMFRLACPAPRSGDAGSRGNRDNFFSLQKPFWIASDCRQEL